MNRIVNILMKLIPELEDSLDMINIFKSEIIIRKYTNKNDKNKLFYKFLTNSINSFKQANSASS